MISHRAARSILQGLSGDPELVAQLKGYIDANEHGPADFEGLSDRQHANLAANRSIEAISRVGTFASDLRTTNARIDALEASLSDMQAVLEAVLDMIEGHPG